MNSRKKKKMMAATMALASIVSAKSKINAALKADAQIGKNFTTAINTKKSGKSFAPIFWGVGGTIAAAALSGYLIHYFTNKNGKNPGDEQDPAEIGVDNGSNGSNTKKNQPKVQKKIWEEDPHGIIKFITWYGAPRHIRGTCIENSYLNMLLNPVFVEEIQNLINEKEKLIKIIGEPGTEEATQNAKEAGWFIDKSNVFKDIWDSRKNHDFIQSLNPQDNYNNKICDKPQEYIGNFSSLYFDPTTYYGNFKNYEKKINGGNNSNSMKIENRYEDNEGYIIGGVMLRINEGHSVYAHLLYDKNKNLSRVIIQNPNSSNNNIKENYVKEMDVNFMKELLEIEKKNKLDFGKGHKGFRIDNFLMIKEEKFDQYKDYWSDESLPA